MELPVAEARKCTPKPGSKPSPKVGAVVVKGGQVLASAFRGEPPYLEEHAEFIVLERKLKDQSLTGATVYTTLEPCAEGSRKLPKIACAERLVRRYVDRVVIGMVDPDDRVSGLGQRRLTESRIQVDMFPIELTLGASHWPGAS